MLVFRNQTSYNRFWDGRNSLTTIHTAIRNMTRTILTHAYNANRTPLSTHEKQDIERTIRVLMAFPIAVKHYLRSEWATWVSRDGNGAGNLIGSITEGGHGAGSYDPEYESLLPTGFEGRESEGLGIPLELTFFVDGFIKRGVERAWFDGPGASQMQTQLNDLTDAYGRMETIKLTPIPIAHL